MLTTALQTSMTFGQTPLPAVEALPLRPALPDPLVCLDGTRVTTAEQWRTVRRPELSRLFEHYMFGQAPDAPEIQARVTRTVNGLFDGKAQLREIEIRYVGWPEGSLPLHVALFVPMERKGPCPVFVGINACGNAEVIAGDAVTIDPTAAARNDRCPETIRGANADFWCVDYLISRGYAFATFHQADLDVDRPDSAVGVQKDARHDGVPAEQQWGTIGAWAWGFQRVVDYLVTDPEIDLKRICLIGHSRRGKTALWAAAQDERVALVVPHQSGTGGMALSRDSQQETVERITRVFPHWFCGEFRKFGNNESRLPFDQHCLVALVAPRRVFDTEGSQDPWANFPRSLDTLHQADSVYRLLGETGISGTGLIQDDEPVNLQTAGRLVQYRRNEKHTLNRGYWEKILDYADATLP